MNKERLALKKDNEELRQNMENIQKERAKLYQDLGTAYTKAKYFDRAIDSYNKALAYDASNGEAHYYLGLLYEHSMADTEKALYHLNEYMKLKPDEKTGQDVKYLIKMLRTERAPGYEIPKH